MSEQAKEFTKLSFQCQEEDTLSFLQLMLKYPADSQIIGHQNRSTGNISVSFIKKLLSDYRSGD